ncbi:MAG: TIGR04086 family membrane protein [Lachnospiraceae bacterium]|nr:TIGR04086 family membrane protein [Lachnospiraceae bacterium]
MELKSEENKKRIILLLKVLLAQGIITMIAILIVSAILLKWNVSANFLQLAVIVIYLVSNFLGGFVIGKTVGKQKFLWGLIVGVLYFVVLSVVSFIIHKSFYGDVGYAMTVLGICAGSSMLGGMLS